MKPGCPWSPELDAEVHQWCETLAEAQLWFPFPSRVRQRAAMLYSFLLVTVPTIRLRESRPAPAPAAAPKPLSPTSIHPFNDWITNHDS